MNADTTPGTETDPPVLFDATRAGVGIISLNRPQKHNAFNPDVIARLSELFDELRSTDSIRVVLIKGEGKSFSAGADIDWMKYAGDYTHGDNEEDAGVMAEMLHRLYALPQPTIALVNGPAVGGGLGLIAASDIAVAVKTAKFRFSEVHLGLTPATISPYVVEAVGPRMARALFTTGESFDAAQAEKMGLVHYVVEDEAALAGMSEHLVKLVFKGAPGAVAAAKKLVQDVMWREIDHHLRHDTSRRIADRRSSDEGKEGLAAFLEKRRPYWAE